MAELADALDLGSSGATRTGSIPARCTKRKFTRYKIVALRAKDNKKAGFNLPSCFEFKWERWENVGSQ